jgi:hypothetical protein
VHSASNIFPSRALAQSTPPSQSEPEEEVPWFNLGSQWFASFEMKVDGKTRYFTFGDRQLASHAVDCLLAALPAEYRHLLAGESDTAVTLSVSLMNVVSLHSDPTAEHPGPENPSAALTDPLLARP